MRVQEDIKTAGYFWLPFAPENQVPGTLSITEGGRIELEIVGLFNEKVNSLKGSREANRSNKNFIDYRIPRIVGQVEKYGMVTLDNCFYLKKNYASIFGGISKSLLFAHKAFLGVAFDEGESILINSFEFSVEGIDEWVGLSGIKISIGMKDNTSSITNKPPETIVFHLNNGMKMMILFYSSVSEIGQITEAKVTQKAFFKLVSEQNRQLDEFTSMSYKLITLLCFALEKTVGIEQVSVTTSEYSLEVGGKNTPQKILLFFQSRPYLKEPPSIDRHKMLFNYPQISENAEEIINNWLNAYDSFGSALNLYFLAVTGSSENLNSRFLTLVQGLETYHRGTTNDTYTNMEEFNSLVETLISVCPDEHRKWLCNRLYRSNEISLSNRIKNIIEPYKEFFGSRSERKKLIWLITVTRNYLTHYDNDLKDEAVHGKEIYELCNKIEAIFQLHLLQVLGFTSDEIKSVFEESLKYKVK